MIRIQGIQEINAHNRTQNRNAGAQNGTAVEGGGGRLSPYPYSVYRPNQRRTSGAV